jgi:hypothetical protein
MDVVAAWTGRRADTLRQALRMTNETFAGYLGVAVRTVAYWRARPDVIPRPVMQEMLDVALARAPGQARALFGLLLAEREQRQAPPLASPPIPASDDVASLTAWITSSNTSDEAIEHIGQATIALADMHTQVTARRVLAEVLQLHRKTQTLLRSGRQRLRQTRELIRIDSDLLAQASVLLDDLGQDGAARKYGKAALLGMQEAETSQAKACYALAKTARWQHRYAEAADLARHGLEEGPVNPMSVQLATTRPTLPLWPGIAPGPSPPARSPRQSPTHGPKPTPESRPGPSRRNGRRSSLCPSRCIPATPTARSERHRQPIEDGLPEIRTSPVRGRRYGSARPSRTCSTEPSSR